MKQRIYLLTFGTPLEKGRVKGHQRRLKSGKVVNVSAYDRKGGQGGGGDAAQYRETGGGALPTADAKYGDVNGKIQAAAQSFDDPQFRAWARDWLSGKDRTEANANSIARALQKKYFEVDQAINAKLMSGEMALFESDPEGDKQEGRRNAMHVACAARAIAQGKRPKDRQFTDEGGTIG